MRQFFRVFVNFKLNKLIYLPVFITIIMILDLTINVRSIVLKRVFFEVCN